MQYLLTISLLIFTLLAKAQSAAINTTDTSKAILTVKDFTAPPHKPLAIFSSPTGTVSIQRGTAIGFNMIPEPQSQLSGFGMELNFNKNTGIFNLTRKSNPVGNNYLVNRNIFRYYEAGNRVALEIARGVPNAGLYVADEMYSKQSGNLNLLPLGAIKIEVTGFTNSTAKVKASNVASNSTLYSGIHNLSIHDGIGIDGTMNLLINLDLITKSYEDIVPIGSMGVSNVGEELQTNFVRFLRKPLPQPDVLQIYISSSKLSGSTQVFGTILVYGLR